MTSYEIEQVIPQSENVALICVGYITMKYCFLSSFIFLISVISADEQSVSPQLKKKLDAIIPEFKVEDVSLKEAILKLQTFTKATDKEKNGINIIFLENPTPSKRKIQSDVEDPFATHDPFADSGERPRTFYINLDAKNIPVWECLKYICSCIDAKYRIDKDAVVVADRGITIDENGWSEYKLDKKIDNLKYKIMQLQKEVDLLEAIKKLPKEKTFNSYTLENVVFEKVHFDNASLSDVEKFIKSQSSLLTKDKNSISTAIYIPADVKLRKVDISANNLSVLDLSHYVAEQLGIAATVEKGEIAFRERKLKTTYAKIYKLNKSELFILNTGKSVLDSLKKFGITFSGIAGAGYNNEKRELTFNNTDENHLKLQKILNLIKD